MGPESSLLLRSPRVHAGVVLTTASHTAPKRANTEVVVASVDFLEEDTIGGVSSFWYLRHRAGISSVAV